MNPDSHARHAWRTPLTCGLLLGALAGCGVSPEPLMVTPIMYTENGLDPFAHLPVARRTPEVNVFYATDRAREAGTGPARYGNTPAESLQLGTARIHFGDDVDWEALHEASRTLERDDDYILQLGAVEELASHPVKRGGGQDAGDELDTTVDVAPLETRDFLAAVNAELSHVNDPEILIYVHGAKVNFYNACVFGAEVDHFSGRDLVTVAFAWPTHQDIFAYAWGDDVDRARHSADSFKALLELLGNGTHARRINIICWSAGGRVVARALSELGEAASAETIERTRIGLVAFEAADVPLHTFLDELPGIHTLAERVLVTASDADIALEKASQIMGEGGRAGSIAEDAPENLDELLEELDRFEIVDVSHGSESRGFDIKGHRYWFRHPWAASDVMLAVRTRLPAPQRGLTPTEHERVWALPADYPDRVRAAVRSALGEAWLQFE